MKIAFVVQRYGAEVLGGSEHLCRLVAERLAGSHDVDVLTSCAQDYITWKNEYPEGTDRVRGVTVRRFANARDARHRRVQRASPSGSSTTPHSRADEMEWLKQQGPWCPGADRVPAAQPSAVRRADLLHLPLRADRARPRGRAAAQHPGVDRARRAGDPARDLQGRVPQAGRALLPHRERAALRRGAVSRAAAARRDRRRRHRPRRSSRSTRAFPRRRPTTSRCRPPRAAMPASPTPTSKTGRPRSTSPHICGRAAPCSAAAIACTARWSCTAAGSIRARAARS